MKLPTFVINADLFSPWSLGADHPTQGRRYSNAKKFFAQEAKDRGVELTVVEPRMATQEELLRVHAPKFISDVTEKYLRFNSFDSDKDQAEIAAMMAGATVQMLEVLLEKKTLTAINFAGAKHHGQYDTASGFCVFSDPALAADIATKGHGMKVAIFDFDGHHGDGTENLCADNPNILTYSVHHYGIFPGTGSRNNPAKHVYNHPLTNGSGDSDLLIATDEFIQLAQEFGADLIFVAAGADGHISDPLTGLEYSVEGYVEVARKIRRTFPTAPFLIGGAGGYQPDDYTPEIWAKFSTEIAAGAKTPPISITKKGKI